MSAGSGRVDAGLSLTMTISAHAHEPPAHPLRRPDHVAVPPAAAVLFVVCLWMRTVMHVRPCLAVQSTRARTPLECACVRVQAVHTELILRAAAPACWPLCSVALKPPRSNEAARSPPQPRAAEAAATAAGLRSGGHGIAMARKARQMRPSPSADVPG